MLKTGKYRAFRNIPVGWVLQAIHSTDRGERLFRIFVELLLILLVYFILISVEFVVPEALVFVLAVAIGHSISWCLTGNFWVYLLDSFLIVKNPGIINVLDYVQLVRRVFVLFSCADDILIYGSMCRGQFHGRSDLDLRIIRRTDSVKGLLALPLGYLLRAYSFFIMMPVDLQVVDSLAFLKKQMRSDEKPIVVFSKDNNKLLDAGLVYSDVLANPDLVMKKT